MKVLASLLLACVLAGCCPSEPATKRTYIHFDREGRAWRIPLTIGSMTRVPALDRGGQDGGE